MTKNRWDHRRGNLIHTCIPEKIPGATYTQIWREAKKYVGSKQTFTKELKRLINLGSVLKEGPYYRRDPAYGQHAPKFYRDLKSKYEERMKAAVEWRHDDPWLGSIHGMPIDNRELSKCLDYIFQGLLREFIIMLDMLVKSDQSVAREIIEAFIEIEAAFVLRVFAQQVWNQRKTISIRKLYPQINEPAPEVSEDRKKGPISDP